MQPPDFGLRRSQSSSKAAHYRARNLVERFFNRIKRCRRVATRYEKLAANYLAFAAWIACQMREGVAGMSRCCTPSGASAFITAFMMVAGAAMAPA